MAVLYPRFPGGLTKVLTLSYDDGVEQDVRLIEILNQYGLKATFNLNSGCYSEDGESFPEGEVHRTLSWKRAEALYKNSGHEIAVHSKTHPFLEQLPSNMVLQELLYDRNALEQQFHTIVRGMAYPFGTYNDEVIACAQKAGLVYGRTIKKDTSFRLPNDWFQIRPTTHHHDADLMELAQKFVDSQPKREPIMFYLWGHGYEFEMFDEWEIIETFASFMGNRTEIWYATNIEIYDYLRAYHRLEFATDGSFVQNPSAIPVWFIMDGELFCVEAGNVLDIKR